MFSGERTRAKLSKLYLHKDWFKTMEHSTPSNRRKRNICKTIQGRRCKNGYHLYKPKMLRSLSKTQNTCEVKFVHSQRSHCVSSSRYASHSWRQGNRAVKKSNRGNENPPWPATKTKSQDGAFDSLHENVRSAIASLLESNAAIIMAVVT